MSEIASENGRLPEADAPPAAPDAASLPAVVIVFPSGHPLEFQARHLNGATRQQAIWALERHLRELWAEEDRDIAERIRARDEARAAAERAERRKSHIIERLKRRKA